MAGTSLLALLDDITTVLDDIAVLTKVAAKKTSGVLGDDLALNAEQVSGVKADRELPVVWAVAKGSFKNKLILVPAALAISALIPWLILPLLMIGGGYLCYEGFEKVFHRIFVPKDEQLKEKVKVLKAAADPKVNMVDFEAKKIKGAIRTDFILSAEIIVIALGTVQDSPFEIQVGVVSAIALFITIFVYGLVAGIVKLDDAGFYLVREKGTQLAAKLKRLLGKGLLAFAPFLMKSLAFIGTAAMFLVGGGILLHGMPFLMPFVALVEQAVVDWPIVGGVFFAITETLIGASVGIVSGGFLLGIISLKTKLIRS